MKWIITRKDITERERERAEEEMKREKAGEVRFGGELFILNIL